MLSKSLIKCLLYIDAKIEELSMSVLFVVLLWRCGDPSLGRGGGAVESNNCKLFVKFPPIDYFKQCPTFALIN